MAAAAQHSYAEVTCGATPASAPAPERASANQQQASAYAVYGDPAQYGESLTSEDNEYSRVMQGALDHKRDQVTRLRAQLDAMAQMTYKLLNVTKHPLADVSELASASDIQQDAENELALWRLECARRA